MLNGCRPISSNSREGSIKNFTETISNKRRNQIHEYYWSLTKDNQNIWISHMGKTITPVRPKKKTTKKNKEDLLESIMWRMTKVKRLGLSENVPHYNRSVDR